MAYGFELLTIDIDSFIACFKELAKISEDQTGRTIQTSRAEANRNMFQKIASGLVGTIPELLPLNIDFD
jgi:hypothetical protein